MQKPSAPPEEEPDEEPDDEESQEEERKQPLAVIPYVRGLSRQIRKAYEKLDLMVIFKSGPLTTHQSEGPFPRRNWQVWSTRSPARVVRYNIMSGKCRGA